MVERSPERNAAVLVGLDFGAGGYAEGIEELGLLAASAGIRARALVRAGGFWCAFRAGRG